ncbi:MAG: biopolymer transporter ExbD [Planctomycetaceae bacterium]
MKFKPTTPAATDVNMTPMIDIVFQLIAFFMVVINFEQTQADERVKLPRDELARPPVKARPSELTINIGFKRDKNGKIISDPFILITGEAREFVWPRDEAELKKVIERIGRSRKRDDKLKETTIIIRADSYCDAGITTDLVDIAQGAGFESFAFAATQKGKQ